MAPPNDKKPGKQQINDLGAELGVALSNAILVAVKKTFVAANFSGLNKALVAGVGTIDASKLLDLSKVSGVMNIALQPKKIELAKFVNFAGVSEGLAKALQPAPINIATTPVETPTINLSGVSESVTEALKPSMIKVIDHLDFTGVRAAIDSMLSVDPTKVVPGGRRVQPTKQSSNKPDQPSQAGDLTGQFIDSTVVDQQLQMQQQYLSIHSDVNVVWDQINQKAEWYGSLLGQTRKEQLSSIANLMQVRELSTKVGKSLEDQATAQKLASTSLANQLGVYNAAIKLQEQEWDIAQDYAEMLNQQLALRTQIKTGLTGVHAAQAAELGLLKAKGLLTKDELVQAISQLKAQQDIHNKGVERITQLEDQITREADLTKSIKEYNVQGKMRHDLGVATLKVSKELQQAGRDSSRVERDISDILKQENQSVADLLLKRNMVQTGLEGEYAQTLTTFMLERGITDVGDKQVKTLMQHLHGRQENIKHLKHEIELYESMSEWQLELVEELEGYTKGWEKLKSRVLSVISDPKILKSFLTVKGLEVLKEGLEETKEIFSEFRAEGMTFVQSLGESKVALGSIFSLSGASLKETAQIQGALVKEMGSMDGVTRDAVVSAGKLSKTLGISAQMAGQLTGQMSNLPGSTAESAAGTLEFAGALSKAAHVAPGAVLEEIAHNSEATATYTKDGSKNIAVAAVAAKKLGLEFGTITKMADGLLDFENSINKQLEASVLLGREINLDKARELSLNGDLVGATQEMLRNVGGEAEFNKMNVLQRKALADSMGVSVQDLAKMVQNQDKLKDLTEEQQKALSEGSMTWDEVLGNAQGVGSRLWDGVTAAGSLAINVRGIATGLKAGLDTATDMWAGMKEGVGLLGKAKGALSGALGHGPEAVPTPSKALETSSGMANKSAELSKAADAGPKAKSGQGIKDFLVNLSEGLKSMAGGKVVLGALNMVPASVGLLAMIPGALGAKVLEIVNGDKLKQSLEGLASGLGSMGTGKVALGSAVMVLASAGFAAMTVGSIGLAAVALLGIPAGAGLTGLAGGISALGTGGVLKGALALGLLGVSLIPAAFAFSLLSEVDTNKIIAFSIALPLLGLAAAGLGLLLPFILSGSLALAAVGASVAVVAGGMMLLQQAEGGFNTLQGFLQAIMGNAAAIPLIGLLGMGLAALGMSALVASPGIVMLSVMLPALASSVMFLGAASSMLQSDLTAVVAELATMVSLVPGLYMVGGGLTSIASGLGAIALAGLAALPALVGLNALPSLGVQVGSTSTENAAPPVMQSNNHAEDSKAVESKLDVLIEEIKTLIQVASKSGVINMDGRKVGEVVRLGLNSSGMR